MVGVVSMNNKIDDDLFDWILVCGGQILQTSTPAVVVVITSTEVLVLTGPCAFRSPPRDSFFASRRSLIWSICLHLVNFTIVVIAIPAMRGSVRSIIYAAIALPFVTVPIFNIIYDGVKKKRNNAGPLDSTAHPTV